MGTSSSGETSHCAARREGACCETEARAGRMALRAAGRESAGPGADEKHPVEALCQTDRVEPR